VVCGTGRGDYHRRRLRGCVSEVVARKAAQDFDVQHIGDLMPKKMEAALKREAKKKGLSKKKAGAYVYGTMRKEGWTPKKKAKKK
jgi:hypothetical protein